MLFVEKNHSFVECASKKCFNSFKQSTVDARGQKYENAIPNVVAETMNLLTNSSNSYQNMDRSRCTMTKYLNDKKSNAAINSKLFKELNHVNNALYDVEISEADIESKGTIIVGFSSFNTGNSECWNFNTIIPLHFVM